MSELGVTYLHLMPLLKPRPGQNDGGYAVMDYRAVRRILAPLMICASWPQCFDPAAFRSPLTLFSTMSRPSISGRSMRERVTVSIAAISTCSPIGSGRTSTRRRCRRSFPISPRAISPSTRSRTPGSGRRSTPWQWDLNWHNPEVFYEFADLILWLANLGVECLRLDAIAFIFKRMGTNCQNQPEVHSITQALRTVAKIAAPALIFKAEAIVGPADLAPYLGVGKHAGKVSDLAYQNSLMVQIWSALAAKDTRLFCAAMNRFPAKPPTTVWGTYLRCHDDIGWAIDDADAASVGLNGFEHRRFLAEYYAGLYPMSDARGLVFQENLETGDRRISGTAASWLGIESALNTGDDSHLDLAIRRYAAGLLPGARIRWSAAALHGRRAGPAQLLRLRRGARARRRQPLGAPTADAVGLGRTPARSTARVEHRIWHGLRHAITVRRALPSLDASVGVGDPRSGEPGGAGVAPPLPEPDHGRASTT